MHRRILVVDDYLPAARATAGLLRVVGHVVTIAHDATDAVALARDFHPDVVFLDIGLQGECDGYVVAQRLRAQPGLEHMVLVALTGLDDDGERQRSIEAGFDYHLVKPVGLDSLQSVIQAA